MPPLRHLALAAVAFAATAPSAYAIDLHAHRGGGLEDGTPIAYENSLSAFKGAPGRGADVVELDVHVSNDGVPFVMHDGTLDRTTDCSGPVADHTAAEIDGCTQAQAIRHVMLPLSRAGIMSVMIFGFTLAMQDFIYALTFISVKEAKPVTLGVVTDLIRGDIFFWGELMAGALIAGLPVAIVYNFFLDEFIAGITSGALK